MTSNSIAAKLVQGSVLALSVSGTAVHAQETSAIEEVVVTAQKRQERMQDVPIAITAFTGPELERKGITDFQSIAVTTPSITFQPVQGDGGNAFVLYMRGQGTSNYPQVVNSEGSVGIYQDGFFIARPQAAVFDIADVERVEVLRGPQGTLYGHNTTGGAVNIISRAPSGEFGIKQNLDFGNRNYFRSLTSVDLPSWHELSVKLTLIKSDIDGYTKNAGGVSNDFGLQRDRGGRMRAVWRPTANFNADYFIEMSDVQSTPNYRDNPSSNGLPVAINGINYTYSGGGRPNSVTFAPIDLPLSKTRFWGQGLTLTLDINDALTIKALTGYHSLDVTSFYRNYELPGAGLYQADALLGQHQFSQELQMVGSLWEGAVEYVGGLYYFKESGVADGHQNRILRFQTDAEARSKAAYGQITWKPGALHRKLELTLGARYTEDDRDVHGVGTLILPNFLIPLYDDPEHSSFGRFNPAFTAKYQWTEGIGTYAKVATGYRAGGTFFGGFPTNNNFKPEEITSYELGLKSDWFDRRLRLNVAAFHNDFQDMQAGVIYTGGYTHIFNVSRATVDGLEIEALFRPLETLTLGVNYAWLNARLDSFKVVPGSLYDPAANPFSPFSVGQDIKDQFSMPNAPKHSFDLTSEYTLWRAAGSTLTAYLDYRYQDRAYSLQAGPTVPGRNLLSQPPFGVLNGRVAFVRTLSQGMRASVSVWGKNILDRKYLISYGPGGPSATASGANVAKAGVPAGFAPTAGQGWAEPPSYGLSLGFEF